MMNKKGTLVLRDIVFMMLIVSSIFVFTGLYVSEMAFNYDNDNMSDEWVLSGTNTIANSTFENVSADMDDAGNQIETGLLDLVTGGLAAMGDILLMIITAPNTIGNLVGGILTDLGVGYGLALIIKNLIIGILWAIVLFTIYSAFLRGGKI